MTKRPQNPRLGSNDAAGAYATVNGIRLYYEIYGTGVPLVLLHGNGGAMDTFENQLPAFRRRFQVIAVDSRMHGRSGGTPETLTYPQMADDVAALLRTLGVGPALVLGWSDGGIVGLLLAMTAPDRVRALAVCGANVQQDETAFEPASLSELREVAAPGSPYSERERALYSLMLNGPTLDFSQLTAEVACPTLVMSGDRDLIRIEHTVKIFQAIPGAELCVFPRADHAFFLSDFELFNQVVEEFFERA
jgi:pimeloyl-ACP methyl ester carboxylesterase